MNAWATVDTVAAVIKLLDFNQQLHIFKRTLGVWRCFPRIVTTAMYLQHTAHATQSEFCSVLVNERVLHSDWLAKYTAAFFNISRSSAVRFNAALSLATSCFNAATSILAAGRFCRSASLIHL